MAKLEYIVVKMDDISSIVSEPQPDEIEDYYQRHRQEYTTSVLSEPNDPNSLMIPKQRSYAEVANQIAEQLLQSKINSKADEIIQKAKILTETGLEEAGLDIMTASAEQIKDHAGDYAQISEALSSEYGIQVYHGQTGFLSAPDMMKDKYLSMMSVSSQSLNIVRLTQVIFSIDELQASELGFFDIAKPKMHQNIGPARDFTGQIIALIKVVDAQKESEPENIDLVFDQSTIQLEPQEKVVYSVQEKVVDDINKLAAFDSAKNKASQFKQGLGTLDWDTAIAELNEAYKKQKGLPSSDPNVFALENLQSLRRVPQSTIKILEVQGQGSPDTQPLIEAQKRRKQFIDNLYEFVPPEETSLQKVPAIMESRSDMSWYVIRNVSINRLYMEDYQKAKAQESFREEYFEAQNLTVIHFNPDNILKRMNFSAVGVSEQPVDANTPEEPSSRI
ncbi:MAG: hypothetical protein ACYTE8_12975 [Planctomycetota bacterium]|jgi:hypothetical protein